MSIEQNISTVCAVYDDFNSRNNAMLLDLVTDDFELVDIALSLSWHGKEGWNEWLQNWAVSMPDAKVHLETIVAQDNLVVPNIQEGERIQDLLTRLPALLHLLGKKFSSNLPRFSKCGKAK
jgi:hypothetical protein